MSVSPTSELSGVCLPAAGNRDMADRPRGPAVLVQARRFLAGIARRPSKYASQTGGLHETWSNRNSCPFGQGKLYCTGRLNRFPEEPERLFFAASEDRARRLLVSCLSFSTFETRRRRGGQMSTSILRDHSLGLRRGGACACSRHRACRESREAPTRWPTRSWTKVLETIV